MTTVPGTHGGQQVAGGELGNRVDRLGPAAGPPRRPPRTPTSPSRPGPGRTRAAPACPPRGCPGPASRPAEQRRRRWPRRRRGSRGVTAHRQLVQLGQQGGQRGVRDVAPVRQVGHGVEVLAHSCWTRSAPSSRLVEQVAAPAAPSRSGRRPGTRPGRRDHPAEHAPASTPRRAVHTTRRRGPATAACRRRRSAAGAGAVRSAGASTGLPSKSVTRYRSPDRSTWPTCRSPWPAPTGVPAAAASGASLRRTRSAQAASRAPSAPVTTWGARSRSASARACQAATSAVSRGGSRHRRGPRCSSAVSRPMAWPERCRPAAARSPAATARRSSTAHSQPSVAPGR